jgi:hypothetical protein
MCSEITYRTRNNPEAAMLNQPTADELQANTAWCNRINCYNDLSKPLPSLRGDGEPVLHAEREAMAAGGQLPAPHAEAIDRTAYDRFMRSLG